MFSNSLKQALDTQWATQKSEIISQSYQVAEIPIKICYWSTYWYEHYQNALDHLLVNDEIGHPHTFTLFVMPSTELDNSQSMVEARKNWLAKVSKEYGVTPAKTDTRHIHSNCHEDFFYLIDMRHQYAIWVFNNHNQVPNSYRVLPFQQLLHELMAQLGKQMAHGAVIAKDNVGILLSGASGTGKTTTILQALKHGYHFVSESCCILSQETQQLYAYSVYNSVKVPQEAEQSFASLLNSNTAIILNTASTIKLGYFLSKQEQIPIQEKVAIKAICNVMLTQQPFPVVNRQEPNESLKLIATNLLYQSNQALNNFLSYFDEVPSYLFGLSTDANKNMECIDELFKQFSSQS